MPACRPSTLTFISEDSMKEGKQQPLNPDDVAAVIQAFSNTVLMQQAKIDLLERAMHLLLERAQHKSQIALALRQSANDLGDAFSSHPLSAPYDEKLTLSLAAMLEVLGEPPSRV
ncbi:hypothetical protein AT395_00090 [Pandoraea apista]|nr:hypothetical protein AT395_00090 [Pandoraea apista]